MVKLYNSLTKKIEEFKPLKDNLVRLYCCGPTVYDYAHIGNLRTYVFEDVLKRTLLYNGFDVKHVMNITDVGHLTSDADEGEDKLEKGAKRDNKTVEEITKFYTEEFFNDLKQLNALPPDVTPFASKHIPEQIEIIKILEDKGFTYDTPEAVYFDVSKFPDYTKLTNQKLEEKLVGAREEVVKDSAKKNPADFALWFKLVGKFADHQLHWPSPWGEGFPGWHIECSAMSRKYLGQPFDIHAGGIDHLPVHHTNEIAQSVAAFEVPLANFWIHGEHLLINQGKMAKSESNFTTLSELISKKYNPLAFRYLVLSSHYRSKLNFTFQSLIAAQNALNNLYSELSSVDQIEEGDAQFEQQFLEALNSDLDTPKALALVWDLVRSKKPGGNVLGSLIKTDKVLGLNIKNNWDEAIKEKQSVTNLVEQYETERSAKNFSQSDELRKQIESSGFIVEDTAEGAKLKKNYGQ